MTKKEILTKLKNFMRENNITIRGGGDHDGMENFLHVYINNELCYDSYMMVDGEDLDAEKLETYIEDFESGERDD